MILRLSSILRRYFICIGPRRTFCTTAVLTNKMPSNILLILRIIAHTGSCTTSEFANIKQKMFHVKHFMKGHDITWITKQKVMM